MPYKVSNMPQTKPLRRIFIATVFFLALCCVHGNTAQAHPLDGTWKGFLVDKELVIDTTAEKIRVDTEKLRIHSITPLESLPSEESWKLIIVDTETRLDYSLPLRVIDGRILEMGSDYYIKDGFTLPHALPKGAWLDKGEYVDTFSVFFMDDNLLAGYKRHEENGPFLENGSMDLIPLGVQGYVPMFRIKTDAADSYYNNETFFRALHKITDNYALTSGVKKTEAGLVPTAEGGVTLVQKMDSPPPLPKKKK